MRWLDTLNLEKQNRYHRIRSHQEVPLKRKLLQLVLVLLLSLGWSMRASAAALNVGDKAPDFTLPDQNGKKVSLNDFLGKKNVVLAFYVLAFTGG